MTTKWHKGNSNAPKSSVEPDHKMSCPSPNKLLKPSEKLSEGLIYFRITLKLVAKDPLCHAEQLRRFPAVPARFLERLFN